MNLKGKTAIVTGGTKGIGRAIAEALVAADSDVFVTARKRGEIDEAVKLLNGLGHGRSSGIVCDVREHTQ